MPASKPVAYQRKTHEQRREDLIAAGIRCLGEGGMSAFTIDKICKQAGVSRGLINHHFKTKDDLLLAIYAHMTRHLVVENQDEDAEDLITDIIEYSFDNATFDRALLRAWLALWGEVATNPALRELHSARYDRYIDRLAGAIRKSARERGTRVEALSVARQLVAIIDGLWLEYCLHSEGFSLNRAKKDCYQFVRASIGR